MKELIWLTLFGLVILTGCDNQKAAEQPAKQEMRADTQKVEKAAVVVAENWLALIDAEDYGKSWEEASIMFKRAVPKEQWVNTLKNSRPGFGKMLNRELKSVKYTKSLPGAPDGQYVVILFNTRFENKEKAIETITPMHDTDGIWRVSGYFIK